MTGRPALGAAGRVVLAVVAFVLSALALRSAIRRLFAAMAAWLLGGLFFVAGMFFLLSAGWRVVRRLLRRRPRPQP